MSNEENNFEEVVVNNQQVLHSKVGHLSDDVNSLYAKANEVKESLDDLNGSGSSSSSHYWAALVLTVIISGLVTLFVMRSVTNEQGDIVKIIRNAPALIKNAVKSAIQGETVSMTIIEGVNKGIAAKLSELNAAIKNYEMKLEEVSKDEGSLTKFCPGFNRSGNRESFKLAQMLAFDKADTDLSFDNAKQICTLDKKGCMVCRVLGRTKPCDYSAAGGCSEVADVVEADTYQGTKKNICGSFTKDSTGWDDSGCGDED